MTIILECLLMAILFNVPMVFRAYHRRRFAEAKLEISRVVTEMELLMLEGDGLRLGDICHDHIYQNMLKAQYATRYSVPWRFWNKAENFEIIRKRLHHEMSQNTQLGKLLIRYGNASFQAFRNNRPGASLGFMFWVLMFAGGISVLFIGLIGIVSAKKGWKNFKQLASESYVVCNSQPTQLA